MKKTRNNTTDIRKKKAEQQSAFSIKPTFDIEKKLHKEGYTLIAGMDEAGRGALAGPLCVGLVIYDVSYIAQSSPDIENINDSKQLSHRRRIAALETIQKNALYYNSILVPPRIIDRLNINGATEFALNRLIQGISNKPDIILLDGNFSFKSTIPIRSIIRGDQRSITIASASIVAKVRRDLILDRLDSVYPAYNFKTNKGYGTRFHIRTIFDTGFSSIHRKSYEPVKSLMRPNDIIENEN